MPDDFDVWDDVLAANTSTYEEISALPLSQEPARQRNVSITVDFNTRKLLMVKEGSLFKFALSEVEFTRDCENTSTSTYVAKLTKFVLLITFSPFLATTNQLHVPTKSARLQLKPHQRHVRTANIQ